MATISARLQKHFGVADTLQACKQLVQAAFPECTNCASQRNLFALASRAGIRVSSERTDHFDGRFQWDEIGNSVITLSTRGNPRRTRFTLAHELGHWLLRESRCSTSTTAFRGVVTGQSVDREEENLADQLAAELLMPIAFVERQLRFCKVGITLVTEIAKRFDVNFMPALRRVADVSRSPILYINAVPRRFRDLTSSAEVDDALYVWPSTRARRDRLGTRFVRDYRFDSIRASRTVKLGLTGSEGRILADFEVRANARPIPNCDLLTTLDGGQLRRC